MKLYARRAAITLVIPLLICAVSIAALYSCTAVITPSPSDILSCLTPPFTYVVSYEKNGFLAECELIGTGGGEFSLTYKQPETLAGIRFNIVGDKRAAMLDGIEIPLGDRQADADIIAAAFSLDPANMTKCEADKEKGVCRAVFTTDIGDVTVTFDSESGQITLIETDGYEIYIDKQ